MRLLQKCFNRKGRKEATQRTQSFEMTLFILCALCVASLRPLRLKK